jgi:hypothetical protein
MRGALAIESGLRDLQALALGCAGRLDLVRAFGDGRILGLQIAERRCGGIGLVTRGGDCVDQSLRGIRLN